MLQLFMQIQQKNEYHMVYSTAQIYMYAIHQNTLSRQYRLKARDGLVISEQYCNVL